jgi:hypothetical protein
MILILQLKGLLQYKSLIMKLFITVLFVSSLFCTSQNDVYEKYKMVDTTQYKLTKALYLYDLTLTESHNEGKVIIEWKKQRNITYYMIEMRDPSTQELIYRQKHYTNNAEFPRDGDFTLYPIFKKQKGEAISINLEEAKARNFEPISPASYYRFLDKQKEIDRKKTALKAKEKQELEATKKYEEERANRITPKVFLLILIVLFLSVLIVIAIWLVRYLTKPKELSRQEIKENNKKWG